MRSEQLLRFVFVNGLAVALGAVVATSCIKVNYPTVAFRCNPRQGDNCPETHFCCSDDPSTPDGALPAYEMKGINGSPPMYADAANAVGRSGMCVRTDDIPTGFGLLSPAALNCPIPCNPTWEPSDVVAVCGGDTPTTRRVCCQTVEVEDKDCVQEGGVWRPVRGDDLLLPGEVPVTNWNPVAHATHQDPNGTACNAISMGVKEPYEACLRNLTVANQRGFCMSLQKGVPGVSADQVCPTDPRPVAEGGAGYISVCDRKNGMAPPV